MRSSGEGCIQYHWCSLDTNTDAQWVETEKEWEEWYVTPRASSGPVVPQTRWWRGQGRILQLQVSKRARPNRHLPFRLSPALWNRSVHCSEPLSLQDFVIIAPGHRHDSLVIHAFLMTWNFLLSYLPYAQLTPVTGMVNHLLHSHCSLWST